MELPSDKYAMVELATSIANELERRRCEQSLSLFCKLAWPIIEPGTELAWNWHLDTICAYLMAFHRGELPDKRLIINVPPGTLKSILVSVMYPAWVWGPGKKPEERYLALSNEQGLSTRDALRMKQIVTSEWYQSKWPLVLQADQNEKTLYANEKRGSRQSQGITGATTGKRADVLLMDDLIDAKHAFSEVIRKSVNDTWDQSLTTRLNDPVKSGIILIMQRLHEQDITGHLLKKVQTKWTHLVIPMRYEGHPTFSAAKDLGRPDLDDPRKKKGELLFPSRFTEQAVLGLEEDLGEYGTAGQLQQRPSPLGGGILKSHWWRVWPDDVPYPVCVHIFHSWDTAFSEKDDKNAAYSACTRWGIFWHEQRERYCIMALGMWYARLGYDELRAKLKELDKKYNPDINLIEKKATGISLVKDMKRASPGRVKAYSPGAGEDKVSRVHSVSPMLQSGQVYIPNKAWALGSDNIVGYKGKPITGLVEYLARFPAGGPPTADLTDTVTQALIYLRAGSWSGDHDDDKDDPRDSADDSAYDGEEQEERNPERVSFYG